MPEVKNLGPFVLPPKSTAPRSFWWWRDLIAEQTDMGTMGALMWLTERASKAGATCFEDGMRNPRAVDPTHACLAPADVGEWLAAAFARPVTYEASVAPAAPALAPVADEQWMDEARAEARKYIADLAKRDQFPNQLVVAERVERVLRERKVYGPNGKPLGAATIKRHALKGISSGQFKAQSVAPRRGK